MSISSFINGVLDELSAEREVDQEAVAQHQARPSDETLGVIASTKSGVPALRTPTAKPAIDNRLGRKEAEKEQMRLQRIVNDAQRTALINNTEIAVVVHAHRQLDAAQDVMMSRFMGVERTKTGNDFMGQVTVELLALAKASVLAQIEAFPKLVAEE